MFPHERSLVKRLEGKPFALIGINTDPNKDQVKKKNADARITWRSFFDTSTSGPISTAWAVQGFPTIYVLDTKGVIRFQGTRGPAMDKAVNTLLKEAGVDIDVNEVSKEESLEEKKEEKKDEKKKAG